MQGKVIAVCASAKKGVKKTPQPQGELVAEFGLRGDAHGGKWHRQISLLAVGSIEKMKALGINAAPGDFAENLTVSGISLPMLPVGTRLKIGHALVEITQIGKECHTHCEIFKTAGACVMPTEGVFAKVIDGGTVRPGDDVIIIEGDKK